MAYIFKSIAATRFLSNMLFIYFFVNCNIFNFHTCCSMYKWVMATLLLLLLKMSKIKNISQTVRDRSISSEFMTHRVVQEYPMLSGKRFGELWPTFEWEIALLPNIIIWLISVKLLDLQYFVPICCSAIFSTATTWSAVWKCISIAKWVIATWSIWNDNHNEWMAYIFKSIAATHFLLSILFMYFFVNCNIFKFYNCCSMYKWVMATLLLLLVKMWKITNISKTVRDRAISSEFLTRRVVQESPVQWGKISIFATFGGHLGFSQKMEKCQYLENRNRQSDFERIFNP